ncbi:hypothetical protein [Deinococcus sp.]|uniref:hypothetical protein n=1 Tax=Deinococcus sp. TaxID=47478 RepID=UPI003C7EC34D
MNSPFRFNSAQTFQFAVWGLRIRLASLLALVVFTVSQGGAGFWLPLIDFVASGALLLLWTPLIIQSLRGRPVLTTDPRRAAVALVYPWLIAYEGALWLLFSLFPAVSGSFPEVNPVASAAQVTVSGVSVAVSFLIYLLSLRQMTNPADTTGRSHLAELFNLAAALSAASVVFSAVPLKGMPPQSAADQWAYALANGVELVSWLLLRWAMVSGKVEQNKAPE